MDPSTRISSKSLEIPLEKNSLATEQFNSHLEQAESIFKEGPLNDANKQLILKQLDQSYRAAVELYSSNKLPPDFHIKAERLFFLGGKCYYNADMVKSLHLFQASVLMSFIKLGLIPDKGQSRIWAHASLEEFHRSFRLESMGQELGLFTDLDQLVCKSTPTYLLQKIPQERLLDIGRLFQNWGACCQNIADLKSNTSENINRFKAVYGFAKICFQQSAQHATDATLRKDALWESASLQYNTGRFLHYLEKSDVEGALATLDEVKPFLDDEGTSGRAQQLRAQIHNITMIETNKLAEKEPDPEKKASMKAKCYAEVSKALEIAVATPGFNDFLKHMFYNNKASFALEIKSTDYEMIGNCVKKATDYAKKENLNDVYYATFFINAAKLSMRMGNTKEALEHLEVADQINQKYADQSADMQAKVKKLKEEIFST